MRVLVVLPTYQEAQNVAEVLRRIRAAMPSADVLVIDDSSPDGTAEVAKSVAAELGRVDVLVRAAKTGLGTAYRAGFAEGLARGYEALVEMDADLSHDPATLPVLVQALAEGPDLVVGSRYVPGGSIPRWSIWRRSLSKWGNRYAAAALGLEVQDATSGFRAYRATAVAKIDLNGIRADGYGFQIEMVYRVAASKGRIVEVPIAFVDRDRGTSKMSTRIVVEALVLVTWWALRDRALRGGVWARRRSGTGDGRVNSH